MNNLTPGRRKKLIQFDEAQDLYKYIEGKNRFCESRPKLTNYNDMGIIIYRIVIACTVLYTHNINLYIPVVFVIPGLGPNDARIPRGIRYIKGNKFRALISASGLLQFNSYRGISHHVEHTLSCTYYYILRCSVGVHTKGGLSRTNLVRHV